MILLAALILSSPSSIVLAEEAELPEEPAAAPISYFGSEALEEAVRDILDDEHSCPQWVFTAVSAGWEPAELPRLLRIMYRESRCIPTACGETDSPHIRKCRDWGLMQINDYSWKKTVRSLGLNMEQMHNPYWNLWFARWLYEYSLGRNGDGWNPWKPIKQEATQ